MAVINTGLLTKGLRSEFFQRFDGTTTHFQTLATRVVSTTDRENYKWLGTVPRLREWGTGRLAQGLRTESYSIENLKYEATLEVDRDEISDDQTGQIRLRIGELAQWAATHKDYLLSQLLNNGATSGNNGYDGVSFFNTDHESGDSGPQSNKLTLNVTTPSNPTLEEFREALRAAIEAMVAFKDDQAAPAMVSASGLAVVVPPNLMFTALEALAPALAGGSPNALSGMARVIVLPWLSSPATWFLLKTDGVIRPFIFQDREPIEFGSLTEDSEEGFRREKFLYGVRARYRMAYGYWQHAVSTLFN